MLKKEGLIYQAKEKLTEKVSAAKAEAEGNLAPEIQESELAKKRLFELIEFIATRVREAGDRQEQEQILTYVLRAIAEEENLNFSHSFYCLQQVEEGLTLADTRYPQPDISRVIETSLSNATGLEKRRYQLELTQFKRLLAVVAELLMEASVKPAGAVDGLGLLAGLDELAKQMTAKQLMDLGFQPAAAALPPEIGRDYDLSLSAERWIAPKRAYVMPVSAHHPGGMAVLVVAQPTYLVKENRFGVEQSQLLIELDNRQLAQLITYLSDQNHVSSPKEASLSEEQLMNQLVQLPGGFTQISNAEAITRLVQLVDPDFQPADQAVSQQNIAHYASLVSRVFRNELASSLGGRGFSSVAESDTIDAATKHRLAEFIYHVVFKGLKNPDHVLDEAGVQKISSVYEQGKARSRRPFAENLLEGLGEINFSPAFTQVTSISQCVGLAPFSSIANMMNLTQGNIANLSPADLRGFIGSERAKLWSRGVCQRCGARTLVGECGLCLKCEMMYGLNSFGFSDQIGPDQASFGGTGLLRNKLGAGGFQANYTPINLSGFVSGEDKRLVAGRS